MKKTAWYPPEIHPVRPGVYECRWRYTGTFFNRWHRGRWMWGARGVSAAKNSTDAIGLGDRLIGWRGVAK